MAGVRLKSLYYSDKNIPYGVEIHDTTLSSDLNIDFDMPYSGSPKLRYEGDEDDIFSPVLACSASFTMWVDTNEHRLFFSQFVTAAEGRFFMRLFYVADGVEITYFVGKVLHDAASLEDSPFQEFSLTAIDAMMELKTLEYAQVGQFHSYIHILVKSCLMQSSVAQFFYTNDVDAIIHVYNEYVSVLHADPTDVLSDTYLENYFYRAVDGQEDRYTCLDVIAEVMRSLGARMYLDNNRYVIEQIRGRDTADEQYTIYNREGVKLGVDNESFDFAISDVSVAYAYTYPNYTFVSPVRVVVLSQSGDYIDNLLFSRKFSYNSNNSAVTIGTLSILDEDLKVYSRIVLKPHVIKNENYLIGNPKFGYIKMLVRIQIGNRFLKGTGKIIQSYSNQISNISIVDGAWTVDSSDRVEIIVPSYVKYLDLQQNAGDNVFTIDITSPVIQATGDIIFDIYSDGVYSNSNANAPLNPTLQPYTSFWESNSSALAILKGLQDGNSTKGTTITTLENELSNTVIYRTNYNMGDFPGTTSKQRLRVNDDKADSTEWVHPDFGNMPYQQLAMHDILAVRRRARRKLDIKFSMNGLLPLTPRSRLVYGAKKYIPLSCGMITGTDDADGIYFEIALNKGVIINPPIEIDPYIVDHEGGFQDNTGGGVVNLQGSASEAFGYYNLVESASNDYVDVSDYESMPDPSTVTADSIRKSMTIHMGGTKQRYYDKAKSELKTGEFRINYAEKRLEWGRSIVGRVIEIDVTDQYVVDNSVIN